MTRRIHDIFLLGASLAMSTSLAAGPSESASEKAATVCGRDISARDVLVLDVRRLVTTPDTAQEYVLGLAGDYRLADPLIQEFRMPFRPSGNPEGVTRGARKLGVKRGCDLVILLKTGPYLGKQRSWKSRVKDNGYALVAVGQRITDRP